MTEQSIFLAALDISDPVERAVYVAAACAGNEALRNEVASLLAAHERPGPFLDEPAVAQMARPDSAETHSAVRGRERAASETRASEAVGSSSEADVLAYLNPPTRPGSLGRLAHYEIQAVLGRGGFGTVLKAFDDRLHRVVAIKVLAPQLAASGTARARFLREGRSAAAVRDLHVVSVHAVGGDDEPLPYLVMEFVGGQTLQQKLDKSGPLPVEAILRIGAQVARGLAAAHATGLIHRDIKPANILLENGVERVKITDFGLARAADDASISQSGAVAGTPLYMAPEQARGTAIDHRADLFSLGSVLYAMCTGRPPFRAETTLAVLKRVCEDAPRPVRELNPDVPGWLARVVEKVHAKDPAARFQTAAEVADLLADCERRRKLPGDADAAARTPAGAPAGPTRGTVRQYAQVVLFFAGLLLTGALIHSAAVQESERPSGVLRLGLAFCAIMFPVLVGTILSTHITPGTPAAKFRRRFLVALGLSVLLLLVLGVFAVTRYREVGDDSASVPPESEPDAEPPRAGETRVRPAAGWRTEAAPPRAVAPFGATRAGELQEGWARAAGVPVEYDNTLGMKMRFIPPGDFTMGSGKTEIDYLLTSVPEYKAGPDWLQKSVRAEGPPLLASVTEPFYLGAHEVTVGQFREFVRASGYKTDAERRPIGRGWNPDKKAWEPKAAHVWNNADLYGSDAHPVVLVSRKDAEAFCAWLTEREGCRYALPTEVQWEYACRAGTTTRWYFGDDPKLMERHGWTGREQMPVGRLKTNPFGLYDVYGNANEMAVGKQGEVVERGGDAGNSPYRARSAKREVQTGEWAAPNTSRGFRVALVTPPKT